MDNLNLSCDQKNCRPTSPSSSQNRPKNGMVFQGWTESIMSDDAVKHGHPETPVFSQSSPMSTTDNFCPANESSLFKQPIHHKDSIKQFTAQADFISDHSNHKVMGRTGKRPQAKNLVAERNRRNKLNDKLYTLRSLVPKITKMDKASILGDAISFVKELETQVKDLQDELMEPSYAEASNSNIQLEARNQNWASHCANSKHKSKMGIIDHKAICASNGKMFAPVIADDNAQEVKVEVTQIDRNEFFLEVSCKHKPHGFVKLMEAMDSLGLVVTNANITNFRGQVLHVFKVEKSGNEIVQADHVRNFLLELTCNPNGGQSGTHSDMGG